MFLLIPCAVTKQHGIGIDLPYLRRSIRTKTEVNPTVVYGGSFKNAGYPRHVGTL